jgi:hypothetical protein
LLLPLHRERIPQASDRAVVEQLWSGFSDLGPLERHVIEIPEQQTAEQTAELVARRLEAGALTT